MRPTYTLSPTLRKSRVMSEGVFSSFSLDNRWALNSTHRARGRGASAVAHRFRCFVSWRRGRSRRRSRATHKNAAQCKRRRRRHAISPLVSCLCSCSFRLTRHIQQFEASRLRSFSFLCFLPLIVVQTGRKLFYFVRQNKDKKSSAKSDDDDLNVEVTAWIVTLDRM